MEMKDNKFIEVGRRNWANVYTRRSNCHQIANLVMGFVYFSSWVELRAVSIVKDVDDLASGATSRTTGQTTTKCSCKIKKKKKKERQIT